MPGMTEEEAFALDKFVTEHDTATVSYFLI
jgi:hypothetical protein